MSASGAIDIPEGETLGFNNLGDYRSIAGPANMKGQKLMSNEACAFAGAAYSVTWDLGTFDNMKHCRRDEMLICLSSSDAEPGLHYWQQSPGLSWILIP
jgi:hypothetical protein